MRIAGRLTSIVGLVGVVVCHGLAFLVWVLRSNLRGRAQDLLAIHGHGARGRRDDHRRVLAVLGWGDDGGRSR